MSIDLTDEALACAEAEEAAEYGPDVAAYLAMETALAKRILAEWNRYREKKGQEYT